MDETGKGMRSGETVVVVSAETMGRGDDWLGAKLLGGFLRSVATVDPSLAAIVFYNAGVKLLGPGSAHLGVLRELQAAGVELLACVVCLDYFDLTKRIEVGRVASMREVAQRMTSAARVVTV